MIQILYAMLGVLAFAVLFHAPVRAYLACALSGGLTWGLYLAMMAWTDQLLPSVAVSVACLTLVSRLFSVILRTPNTVFIVCGVFPLVPGSGIYYTAYYLFLGDMAQMSAAGSTTLLSALGIALGIIIGSAMPQRWILRLGRALRHLFFGKAQEKA